MRRSLHFHLLTSGYNSSCPNPIDSMDVCCAVGGSKRWRLGPDPVWEGGGVCILCGRRETGASRLSVRSVSQAQYTSTSI